MHGHSSEKDHRNPRLSRQKHPPSSESSHKRIPPANKSPQGRRHPTHNPTNHPSHNPNTQHVPNAPKNVTRNTGR